jgi:hypothetical protein
MLDVVGERVGWPRERPGQTNTKWSHTSENVTNHRITVSPNIFSQELESFILLEYYKKTGTTVKGDVDLVLEVFQGASRSP